MFRSTKHYGHEVGLSACFRQWRADSHCRLLHGYALAFTFVFEAKELDHRNWVVDFGGLDWLKGELRNAFDHKLVVAADDPELEYFKGLEERGLAHVAIFRNVGCEAFAQIGFRMAQEAISSQLHRVKVVSCEVREHGANSAIFMGP